MLVAYALFRMCGDQDRAARRQERRLDPYSDVTITRFGNNWAVPGSEPLQHRREIAAGQRFVACLGDLR